MSRQKAVSLVLQLSVAFFFIYSIIGAAVHPDDWIGNSPTLFHLHFSTSLILEVWGTIQFVVAIWILSGKRIFLPSLFASIILLALVLFNLSGFDILFRNLSIAGAAFCLCIMHFPRSNETNRRTH